MTKEVKEKAAQIKTWIKEKFNPDDFDHRKGIERMVLAIWDRQTTAEQTTEQTIDRNSRGYNGVDADFAGRIVKAIYNPDYSSISKGMARAAAKMMAKYSRQLAEIKLENESK